MAEHTTTSEDNPYQAPQATSKGRLPFDTEFLVSETCVACEDNLKLPPVCIVSGATKDLVRLQKRISHYPTWLIILFIVLLFCIPNILNALDQGQLPKQISEGITTLSVIGVLFFVAVFSLFLVRRSIEATWYVHQSQIVKLDKRKRFFGLLLAGSVALGAIIAGLDYFEILFLPIIAFCMIGASLFKAAPPSPIFRGRHEGLNVVMGLSPEFLAQVQAMIEQHAAGQHE